MMFNVYSIADTQSPNEAITKRYLTEVRHSDIENITKYFHSDKNETKSRKAIYLHEYSA